MTRLVLAVLGALALSVGALQVRAQEIPTEGGGVECLQGSGPLCRIVTITKCDSWEWVKITFMLPISIGYKQECTKTSTTEKKYYYTH